MSEPLRDVDPLPVSPKAREWRAVAWDDEDMAESEPLPTREAAEAELRDLIEAEPPYEHNGIECRTPAGPWERVRVREVLEEDK